MRRLRGLSIVCLRALGCLAAGGRRPSEAPPPPTGSQPPEARPPEVRAPGAPSRVDVLLAR